MTRTEYLLTCLAEESSEIIQAVSKILRFGLEDKYMPADKNNYESLIQEVNDLFAIVEMLKKEKIVVEVTTERLERKQEKVEHFIEYSKNMGIIK